MGLELFPENWVRCYRLRLITENHKRIRFHSIVDDDCFPYIAASNKCKVRRTDTLASAGCRLPTKTNRNHLYRVGPAYSLNNETDIMIEIMESGPVQGRNKFFFQRLNFDQLFDVFPATMRVYRDFFAYKEGVYKHSAASRADEGGFHSVRLVGWGVERNGFETTKYWVKKNFKNCFTVRMRNEFFFTFLDRC